MINTGGVGHWGGDTNDMSLKGCSWFLVRVLILPITNEQHSKLVTKLVKW